MIGALSVAGNFNRQEMAPGVFFFSESMFT